MLLFCEHAFRISFYDTKLCSGKVDVAAFCERGAQTLLQNPYEIKDAFSKQNRQKIVPKLIRTRFPTEICEKVVPGPLLGAPGAVLERPGRAFGPPGALPGRPETIFGRSWAPPGRL